jgi:hypothetical protein
MVQSSAQYLVCNFCALGETEWGVEASSFACLGARDETVPSENVIDAAAALLQDYSAKNVDAESVAESLC